MGGGNCLFGTEIKVPLFRGNNPVIEVASADTNPTKLPDTEALRSGAMDKSTRCFDLLCTGRVMSGSELKLNIQPAKEIPQLITKNATGEIVYKEPKPMCTIQSPKGHNVWVNIELKTITTGTSDCMCLGIKKCGEESYYDVLYSGNLSRYVDVQEDDIVELIPLISASKLPTYSPVKMDDLVTNTESTYDFGSVYRVNITLSKERWIKTKIDTLESTVGDEWVSRCQLGVRMLDGKNQLVVVKSNGQVFSSFDGIHWICAGSIYEGANNGSNWKDGIVFGNDIFCICNTSSGEVRYRINDTWFVSRNSVLSRLKVLTFGNGVFMAVSDNKRVYISSDGEFWKQIGTLPSVSSNIRFLGYDGEKWICGTTNGVNSYYSENGEGEWCPLASNLAHIIEPTKRKWIHGCCFAKGYFFVVDTDYGYIVKSKDGENWEKIAELNCSEHYNVTYFDNKLYLLAAGGDHCHIGLFNPDGTI